MMRTALNLFFLIISAQIAYIHPLFSYQMCIFIKARKMSDLKAFEKKKRKNSGMSNS